MQLKKRTEKSQLFSSYRNRNINYNNSTDSGLVRTEIKMIIIVILITVGISRSNDNNNNDNNKNGEEVKTKKKVGEAYQKIVISNSWQLLSKDLQFSAFWSPSHKVRFFERSPLISLETGNHEQKH